MPALTVLANPPLSYRGVSVDYKAGKYVATLYRHGSPVRVRANSLAQAKRQIGMALKNGATVGLTSTLPRKNPPRRRPTDFVVGVLSDDVHFLSYKHFEDGQLYEHKFQGTGVRALLLRDGTVLLQQKNGKRLWGDF